MFSGKFALISAILATLISSPPYARRVCGGEQEPAARQPVTRKASSDHRYDSSDQRRWFPGALAQGVSPVDLSFLNRDDRPGGRRGFVRADGDRLVFADGSPARFWGGNLAAGILSLGPARAKSRRQRTAWPSSATT